MSRPNRAPTTPAHGNRHKRLLDAALQAATGLAQLLRFRSACATADSAAVAIASSRRGSDDDPIYVDLVLWDVQAAFAAAHLVKGQMVTFSGRLEPRQWTDRDGNTRTSIEVQSVELEYGAKPGGAGAPDPAEEVPAS